MRAFGLTVGGMLWVGLLSIKLSFIFIFFFLRFPSWAQLPFLVSLAALSLQCDLEVHGELRFKILYALAREGSQGSICHVGSTASTCSIAVNF